MKKFDDETSARVRYDRNIPLKKNMTHKQLFKDSVPIKEEKLNSQNTPREQQKKENHRNEKSLDAYPGVKSTEKLHKSGSRELV